jgi:hypothetical protein
MWHLEESDKPGVRVGGYFFTKAAAEKKIKKPAAPKTGETIHSGIVAKLKVVKSK